MYVCNVYMWVCMYICGYVCICMHVMYVHVHICMISMHVIHGCYSII